MKTYSVFRDDVRVARGDLSIVLNSFRGRAVQGILIEDATGRTIDVDSEGALAPELAAEKPARGRPRLGVTAREITLLPRHWDWLAARPGGASAALRRLVDEARRANAGEDERRQITEAAYRVATTLGGDRPGYEEAIRALFANDIAAFYDRIAAWPPDIAAYLRELTGPLSATAQASSEP